MWDPADVAKILQAVDRGNPCGKRDYAIILLITRLGLRGIDVKRLQFGDLDWPGNRLSVVQAKTGHRVQLPLLKDVGWAVIDYIRSGRPASDCPQVFIRHTAPIGPFSDQDHLHQILVKHARAAHVPVGEKRRHGMHSLRHTLATGLRHCDFVSRKREAHIVPRADNANRARAKMRSAVVVPVSTPLVRLYSEYMHVEYGDIDSDYVFVNLFAGQVGAAMTYPAVHQLIGRIAARTGIGFTAHMLRHSHATEMEVSRIASDASFGTSREHALPAAQRAALRPAWRAGAAGGAVTCDVSGWLHQTPGCVI